jgi:8-hydroxy-5-deazaflavin:NADPH oxidoreductase
MCVDCVDRHVDDRVVTNFPTRDQGRLEMPSETSSVMKITTIGRGTIGGTLARLWTSAGHEVTQLGRDGGDAADADVVLLAVPSQAVPAALAGVSGLREKAIIDATNRLKGEAPPTGYRSIAEYVKATTNGPTAKAFNLNFGKLFDQAGDAATQPNNIWVGDDGIRAAVESARRGRSSKRACGGAPERARCRLDCG